MIRPAFLLATITIGLAGPAQAQAQMAHHHPRGAKIIMMGTVVDPLCAFALAVPDSAEARCSQQHPRTTVQPVLLADSELYVLEYGRTPAIAGTDPRPMLGKHVKADGTVYPAGASYLIVVDSIRVLPP